MTPHCRAVLRLADSNLVLAQRLGEWVGHAPALEEDLGLANVSLDLLGQARLLLARAGELEGRGRDEDALAYLREEHEFLNLTLVEQPNGDFADTIARQVLFDAWQLGLCESLAASSDAPLAAIAAKGRAEASYHLRYSGGWLERLGDGTAESHERAQRALEKLWPFVNELFADDDVDREVAEARIAPLPSSLEKAWSARVDAVLAAATLARPAPVPFPWFGKQGRHSEHLGYLLAEMQSLHRAHPGATW
ncbi:MAG TPA: 1,2-phenylacetyl-CoA epoxidase subunit PaaC [Steroidobacteraceae bacterium]|nr:1,2-phenylacetyl-CoA epoxidase subunit PaaC [Steroidobacteraceae bacterium]